MSFRSTRVRGSGTHPDLTLTAGCFAVRGIFDLLLYALPSSVWAGSQLDARKRLRLYQAGDWRLMLLHIKEVLNSSDGHVPVGAAIEYEVVEGTQGPRAVSAVILSRTAIQRAMEWPAGKPNSTPTLDGARYGTVVELCGKGYVGNGSGRVCLGTAAHPVCITREPMGENRARAPCRRGDRAGAWRCTPQRRWQI